MRALVTTVAFAVVLATPGLAFAQGAMTNGANHPGAISFPGELDEWTFTAAQGDALSISIGEVLPATDPMFFPWIRLIGPNGALLDSGAGALVGQIDITAPLSGAYTVRVSSSDNGNDGTGAYLLTLAKTPGTFVVPSGDEGGPLTNGDNHPGRIHLGDLDQWTFTAAQGDAITLSIGEVFEGQVDPGLVPWIRLRSPTGALLSSDTGALAAQINIASAPMAGIYTVVVGTADNSRDTTGLYRLTLAKTPGTFIVPAGDEGGPLANGIASAGAIHLGDIDQWTFTAAQGSAITVSISEVVQQPDTGFVPWIRLRGPTGTLLASDTGALTAQININAPASGLYTVIAGTGDNGNDTTGVYLITVLGSTTVSVPTTVNDAYATSLNVPLTVPAPGVLTNDASNGGGPMTAELVSPVSSGTLILAANGSVTYAPAPGFAGTVSFTYRAVNGAGPGNVATVVLTVTTTATVEPPTGVFVSSVVGNTVTLRWTPPPGGLPPTDYVLEGGVNPGEVLASIFVGSANPIYTFVAPTGAFHARIHTLSGASRSGPSNEIRIFVNVTGRTIGSCGSARPGERLVCRARLAQHIRRRCSRRPGPRRDGRGHHLDCAWPGRQFPLRRRPSWRLRAGSPSRQRRRQQPPVECRHPDVPRGLLGGPSTACQVPGVPKRQHDRRDLGPGNQRTGAHHLCAERDWSVCGLLRHDRANVEWNRRTGQLPAERCGREPLRDQRGHVLAARRDSVAGGPVCRSAVGSSRIRQREGSTMANETTRRDMLKTSLAVAGLGLAGDAGMGLAGAGAGRNARAVHRLAGELQPEAGAGPPPARHPHDRRRRSRRRISSSPRSTTAIPVVDPGAVSAEGRRAWSTRPPALSLDDLRKMGNAELVAGFECSGNRRPLQGLCGNGRWTGVPLQDGARAGRPQGQRPRVRVLRRRPRTGRSRVPHPEVQGRTAVRPQPAARQGAVTGAVPRLRAQRRAAHAAPGLAAPPDRARLVRRAEREVALARSTRRRISTSASSRRAGTGRSRAR